MTIAQETVFFPSVKNHFVDKSYLILLPRTKFSPKPIDFVRILIVGSKGRDQDKRVLK